MNYPQFPSRYEPYPGYPASTAPPSGTTAIIAGVLAAIGAVGQLLSGAVNVFFGISDAVDRLSDYDSTGLFAQSWYKPFVVSTGLIAIVSGALLGLGAIALLTRRRSGVIAIVIGCAIVVVLGVISLIVTLNYSADSVPSAQLGGVAGAIGLLFPVGTAVLALVPSTRRWLEFKAAQPYPVPAGYPYGNPQMYSAPTSFGAPPYPAAPGAPMAPSMPGSPLATGTPAVPSVGPETPAAPGPSVGPGTSAVPGAPVGPETPAAPGAPVASGTPVASQWSSPAAQPDQPLGAFDYPPMPESGAPESSADDQWRRPSS
ncbi:hypothetical protein [Nocardia arthritidis]|uniref:Uncharacterized protein n=1 Tax=Nocardia arthritidis TaxID=228602 RepID=A0A6G9Y4F1_9NOCA|nr:hypothetical protein [Nocardia arthritidis]QIS08079.1 hypothetical protein F5544_00735 [Nocardia arthritidis]